MCGIAGGLLGKRSDVTLHALLHRGPDDQGCWTASEDAEMTLVHARLSILDPEPRSRQPFRYGPVTLAYNGELWNYQDVRRVLEGQGHRFTTRGDTEVLAAALAAWDVEALPRLQGMFAFAWHDARRPGELRLVRDRFGEVPLHIAQALEPAFASERKGLIAAGYPAAAVTDAEPGAVYSLTRQGYARRQWYDAPIRPITCSRAAAASRLRTLLEAGVTERRISDVPICTLLSGGIDSAIIARFLRDVSPGLVAYTAVYDPKSADLRAARETARYLGIELREVAVPAPTADDLSGVIRHIEMSYKAQIEIGWPCLLLARQMQADGFKVTFSGEGSDELWASYAFCYHALASGADWYQYRKSLFLSQAKKNFMRCNKIFMAHGVECRLPFLNTDLVEFALSLSQDVVRDGKNRPKAVLQEAMYGELPDRIISRPKTAFQDGMGLKAAIAARLPSPLRFYRAEYRNLYGSGVAGE